MPKTTVLVTGRAPDNTPVELHLTADGRLQFGPGSLAAAAWAPHYFANTAVGNQKDFTVPANREWHILGVFARLVSDANAGDRLVAVRVLRGGGLVDEASVVGAPQAQNLTRFYHIAPSAADLFAFRDTDWLMTPLQPTMILEAGTVVRVLDRNVVSALDTLSVWLHYAERTVS